MTPAPHEPSGDQRSLAARFSALFQARPDRPARLLLCLAAAVMAAVLGIASWDAMFPAAQEGLRVTADQASRVRILPPVEEANGRMCINDAAPEDLQRASGIGPKLAQAIVDTRAEMGGFRFWEELLDVPGVGQKRLDALAEYFYCPAEP